MTHKTMAGKHGTIHYWTEGEGDQTILLTHGATMDHGLFQYQAEHFAPRFRVITWDAPAHGLSRPYAPFSLQNAAHELIAILDAEAVSQAHLVGQSMGGYICQIAAVEHPERVRTITAVDSSPVQLSYYSDLDRWLLSITPALLKFYPYSTLVNLVAKQIALAPAAQDYALATLKALTKQEIIHIMGAVYSGLIQCNYAHLACPILVVYGEKDITGKVRAYCNRWAEQEKRTLQIIPRAAHNANMDNPGAFNQVLDDFITLSGRKD